MVSRITKLFAGEVLDQEAGFPTLYKYSPADPRKPLIVFIPGSGHNARIAYGGHPACAPEDFLAFWLNKHGHGLLAISYPIESEPELIPATAPHFRIRDWGKQAAEITHKIIQRHSLCNQVILIAWSMGGRILTPYCVHVHGKGIKVALFASLAATPGVHGSRPPPPHMSTTVSGYARATNQDNPFALQIDEQNQKFNNGRAIFPVDAYPRDYCGFTPVALTGWGFRYDHESCKFVVDNYISTEDAAADQFEHWPMIVALTGTSPLDARHVITDQAIWSYMLTRKLMHMIEVIGVKKLNKKGNWQKLIELVHSLPNKMCYSVPGNHFFFIGESGARKTAEIIIGHLEKAREFQSEFEALLKE